MYIEVGKGDIFMEQKMSRGIGGYLKLGGQVVMQCGAPFLAVPSILSKSGLANPASYAPEEIWTGWQY